MQVNQTLSSLDLGKNHIAAKGAALIGEALKVLLHYSCMLLLIVRR